MSCAFLLHIPGAGFRLQQQKYQTIGSIKAYGTIHHKDTSELKFTLLKVMNSSHYYCWGEGIQNM